MSPQREASGRASSGFGGARDAQGRIEWLLSNAQGAPPLAPDQMTGEQRGRVHAYAMALTMVKLGDDYPTTVRLRRFFRRRLPSPVPTGEGTGA